MAAITEGGTALRPSVPTDRIMRIRTATAITGHIPAIAITGPTARTAIATAIRAITPDITPATPATTIRLRAHTWAGGTRGFTSGFSSNRFVEAAAAT